MVGGAIAVSIVAVTNGEREIEADLEDLAKRVIKLLLQLLVHPPQSCYSSAYYQTLVEPTLRKPRRNPCEHRFENSCLQTCSFR
jgi:hypothetical protein